MIKYQIIIANMILVAFLGYSQNTIAKEFTSATVLEWPEASQNSLFQSSVTMIGFVAAQVDAHSHIARCVSDWYWKGEQADPAKNEAIRNAMRRFPEYHPQMVILAVVEKACGKFGKS